MSLAIRHREIFSSAASHSGAYWFGDDIRRQTLADPARADARDRELIEILGPTQKNWRDQNLIQLAKTLHDGELSIYFDCGREDEAGFYEQAVEFDEQLTQAGIVHTFVSVPGRHHESLWKQRIIISLKFHADHFRKMAAYPE